MKALINKSTLKKICEEKGVSGEYLSKKCGIDIEKIRFYLEPNDSKLPAFGQAKDIARKLHVPFAGLYMEPEKLPLKQIKMLKIINYRSIQLVGNDDSAVNLAIYDLMDAKEEIQKVFELVGEEYPSFDLIPPGGSDIKEWANYIRTVFCIDLDKQLSTTSTRQLYLYIREKIEEQGIIVQSFTGVPVEELRGIAIFGENPIIGVNDKDRYPGKTFSLIHELVHILKRQSTVCNEMITSFSQRKEEVFCNAVAGEVLVPKEELRKALRLRGQTGILYDDLKHYSDLFSVSREVIARRLFDNNALSQEEYDSMSKQLVKDFNDDREKYREESRKAREEGRPYGFPKQQERVAIDRNSTNYCMALCKGYYSDLLTKQDLSRSLNIKVKHIDKFIQEVGKWGS